MTLLDIVTRSKSFLVTKEPSGTDDPKTLSPAITLSVYVKSLSGKYKRFFLFC